MDEKQAVRASDPYSVITPARASMPMVVSQYSETCNDCGGRMAHGKLCRVANDYVDMRNGHRLLCQECKAVWQAARDALLAMIEVEHEQLAPLTDARRTALEIPDKALEWHI
jgi:hypothetical protein